MSSLKTRKIVRCICYLFFLLFCWLSMVTETFVLQHRCSYKISPNLQNKCIDPFRNIITGRTCMSLMDDGNKRYDRSHRMKKKENKAKLEESPSSSKVDSLSSSAKYHKTANDRKGAYWVGTDDLNRLKESVDIISLIESYGLDKFQRQGDATRATAICPFHDDHNPSLSIDGNRRIYNCFACGARGDAFNFVREYSNLERGENNPMSFFEAITIVNNYQLKLGTGSPILHLDKTFSPSANQLHRKNDKELEERKQRIYLANAAAAAYYVECLTLPSAGAARSYLQSRIITPTTVRDFVMGFAPDVYFGQHQQQSLQSLVYHLKKLGFTPSEILDAGLAVRTKKKSTNAIAENVTIHYDSLMDKFRGRIVVPIMDASGNKVIAFGGRILPTPIQEDDINKKFQPPKYLNSPESVVFQKKNVLFGHHMARDVIRKNTQVQGKYKKGNGQPQHSPIRATEGAKNCLVIVEGYMDAIKLWQVGFGSVVASMGTALSSSQMETAAQVLGTCGGGQLVICLDNDDAGIAAVERLCTSEILSSTTQKFHSVEIRIATLPENVKDPDDFIESASNKNGQEAADAFRKQVIDIAIDWIDWYLTRLISKYDTTAIRGQSGSFGDVFDRAAGFLSTCFQDNAADRTKHSYQFANSLATIMAKEMNSTSISTAAQIQLESDLIDLATRKANEKNAIKRRVESISINSWEKKSESVRSSSSLESPSSLLSAFSRGFGPRGNDDEGTKKLSQKALKLTGGVAAASSKIVTSSTEKRKSKKVSSSNASQRPPISQRRGDNKSFPRSRKLTYRQSKKKAATLTPHFSGFEFKHKSDAEWLSRRNNSKGRRKKEGNLVLGAVNRRWGSKYIDATDFGINMYNQDNYDNPVYFNSNKYHGNNFLTSEALNAGYNKNQQYNPAAALVNVFGDLPKSAMQKNIQEKGFDALIQENSESMILSMEESLLRFLLRYNSARSAIRNAQLLNHQQHGSVITNSNSISKNATADTEDIDWSCSERKWLFDSLVNENITVSSLSISEDEMKEQDGCSNSSGTFARTKVKEVLTQLTRLQDVPARAFGYKLIKDNIIETHSVTIVTEPTLEKEKEFEMDLDLDLELGFSSSTGDVENLVDIGSVDDHEFLSKITRLSNDDSEPFIHLLKEVENNNNSDYYHNHFNNATNRKTELSPSPAADDLFLSFSSCDEGPLDQFFLQLAGDQEDGDPYDRNFKTAHEASIPPEEKAELFAQELYSSLIWRTAEKKAKVIRSEWMLVSQHILKRLAATSEEMVPNDETSTHSPITDNGNNKGKNQNSTTMTPSITSSKHVKLENNDITTTVTKSDTTTVAAINLSGAQEVHEDRRKKDEYYEKMKLAELEELCEQLAHYVKESTDHVANLFESSKRISKRVFDYSNSAGFEGRLSTLHQKKLAANLDEHAKELSEHNITSKATADEVNRIDHNNDYDSLTMGINDDEEEEEPMEDFLARVEADWGQWLIRSGDEIYESDNNIINVPNNEHENEEEENLEEELARMDREWSRWISNEEDGGVS